MADFTDKGAVKIIEVIGMSGVGFDDAVRQAVAKAAESISGITGVEVQTFNAQVEDGAVVQYRATVKLAFAVR